MTIGVIRIQCRVMLAHKSTQSRLSEPDSQPNRVVDALIDLRPFRNPDIPAITKLWNRAAPVPGSARPLSAHEFESHVVGRLGFDAAGLIVAVSEGNLVGFVHAGFGPDSENSPPMAFTHDMGTIAMLVTLPGQDEEAIATALLQAAKSYLRDRGAKVIYAGVHNPLNPFYWGIYGGSEWAGIVDSHVGFHRAVGREGFIPSSSMVMLEADLTQAEARDPKAVLIRRHTRVETTPDVLPATWWESLAIGEFRPTLFRLLLKNGDYEIARATIWDMSWFGRLDGRSRVGLIDVEVESTSRRKGYGRFLVGEILKHARSEATEVVAVQTRETNVAAIALYESAGFQVVGTSTFYRLPG